MSVTKVYTVEFSMTEELGLLNIADHLVNIMERNYNVTPKIMMLAVRDKDEHTS